MAERIAISSIVATLAFWAYTQTLLPGVDLGDTGGFQAAVLWPEVSARQAYPLYYASGATVRHCCRAPSNPARALNLFSAVWAAAAVGLLTFVMRLRHATRSVAASLPGTLLAFSYTFWTQAHHRRGLFTAPGADRACASWRCTRTRTARHDAAASSSSPCMPRRSATTSR